MLNFQTRKLENIHILMWLLKDLAWVTLSRAAGMFMIFPTLALAVYITILNRKEKAELAHNLAVCFWICANSVWMVGEFYYDDTTRPLAIIFFVAGLFMMVRYHLVNLYRKRPRLQKKTG